MGGICSSARLFGASVWGDERKHIVTPEFVTGLGIEAIKMIGMLAGPLLLMGLVIGLMVSIFQAVTSIQEMTLTFIPKMVIVGVTLMVLFPWMLEMMTEYTTRIITEIPLYIR